MECQHLCLNHQRIIRFNENEALEFWNRSMRLGTQHFTECRWDTASAALTTAAEISLLRLIQANNHFFCIAFWLRPMDFLMEQFFSDPGAQLATELENLCQQLTQNIKENNQVLLQHFAFKYWQKLPPINRDSNITAKVRNALLVTMGIESSSDSITCH